MRRTTPPDSDTADELRLIKNEMEELLNEARRLVRGTSEEDRAKGYWYAHIRCALDNEHDYLGGSMVTMQDSIDALLTAGIQESAEAMIAETEAKLGR